MTNIIVFSNKIIDDFNVETTQSELCKKYKMSKAVVSRLVSIYKTKGTIETTHLGRQPKKSTPHTDEIEFVNWNSIFQKILYDGAQ